MTRDDIVAARAYLLRVAEPPALHLHAYVARYGPVAAADHVRTGDVPDTVRTETEARRDIDLGAQDLELAAAAGARLVIPEDPEWPQWRFHALGLAARRGVRYTGEPLALWAAGRSLAELGDTVVAVIGSRAATSYGERIAAEFAHGLAERGVTVVSGAAYGIDGAAHRGALAADPRTLSGSHPIAGADDSRSATAGSATVGGAISGAVVGGAVVGGGVAGGGVAGGDDATAGSAPAGGGTVAVLGCGIDVPYPAGHDTLLARIREHGTLLSEYPPGSPPARHRFLVRNRLIAALADGTVVVEAGKRSGARNTAATSRALGRELLVVPGPVTSAMSVGCHDLLRSGDGVVVSTVDEVLESVGRIGSGLESPPGQRAVVDGLEQEARRVYEALSVRRYRQPEQLAVEAGIQVTAVHAILASLELTGLATRADTGWRRVGTSKNRRAPGE